MGSALNRKHFVNGEIEVSGLVQANSENVKFPIVLTYMTPGTFQSPRLRLMAKPYRAFLFSSM